MKISLKHLSIPALAILLISQNSCLKGHGDGHDFPPSSRVVYLLEYTWGLKSATSIPELSSGVLHNYRGTPADSISFGYTLTPNLGGYGIYSSIRGMYNYIGIDSITRAKNVLQSDTSTIAYDTLALAGPWLPSYGDTILISKASISTLVFRIPYADSLGNGIEIDTFRNIRVH